MTRNGEPTSEPERPTDPGRPHGERDGERDHAPRNGGRSQQAELEDLLREWLPTQRWFAGKGRDIAAVRIVSDTELPGEQDRASGPRLRHLIAAVDHGEVVHYYQVPVGLRVQLPQRLRYALIGPSGSWTVYDAVHDPELTHVLLANMAAGADVGDLAFRTTPDTDLRTGGTSLVIGTEQSNTSFVYDEDYVCKLFRRLEPGPNPDLEMSLALAEAGSSHVAAPYGWIDGTLDGTTTTLAMLQTYLRTASEAWALAVTSVRDLYAEADLHPDEVGGDFAAESQRLGAATAEVHGDLARAFPTDTLDGGQLRDLAQAMRARLEQTCDIVPQLEPYARGLAAAFDALGDLTGPVSVQRIHGDYHLGQVVRTDHGWVLLDFEGEPIKTLTERRALASPLRDVAGMLRSFDYAARHLLTEHPEGSQLEYRAREWTERNRSAFCRGYADAGGVDPDENATVLRAFEFDKAVYEVMYEARNRPTWLKIPLASVAHMVETAQ